MINLGSMQIPINSATKTNLKDGGASVTINAAADTSTPAINL